MSDDRWEELEREEGEVEKQHLAADMGKLGLAAIGGALVGGPLAIAALLGVGAKAIYDKDKRDRERRGE
jgi:hypothetical protein